MSRPDPFGLSRPFLPPAAEQGTEQLVVQRALRRVMAFTGRSIDDIVNDPIAKNQVLGYYKLHKQVWRACEVVDLENWWNGKTLAGDHKR